MIANFFMNRSGMNLILLKRSISSSSVVWQQKSSPGDSKFDSIIMRSYLRFMAYYENKLEKNFPAAMKVYKVFKFGIHSFFQDLKSFVKVRLTVLSLSKDEGFYCLSRKEIELYDQMPKDMMKIAPVLLFSALPFANYVVFPLAYMYPKKLLTSHFWTDEQKREFNDAVLRERLKNCSYMMKDLQQRSKSIGDPAVLRQWSEVLRQLQAGGCPSTQQVLQCKDLFSSGPFSIPNLHFTHRRHLLRLHGLSYGFSPCSKLYQRAFLLKEMDKAIAREGGVIKMKEEDIRIACVYRGLPTFQLSKEDIMHMLEKWTILSKNINSNSFSLLLHSPIFIGNSTYFLSQK